LTNHANYFDYDYIFECLDPDGNKVIEEWRAIKEWEGLYEVSNFGRVRSLIRIHTNTLGRKRKYGGIIMKFKTDKDYKRINLQRQGHIKTLNVHRLVGHAFIQNPENKPEINHKDGHKFHNKAYNLEWSTSSENTLHAFKNGLMVSKKGENSNNCKLTEAKVLEIRALRGKVTQPELVRKYGVNQATISAIQLRKRWKHVD